MQAGTFLKEKFRAAFSSGTLLSLLCILFSFFFSLFHSLLARKSEWKGDLLIWRVNLTLVTVPHLKPWTVSTFVRASHRGLWQWEQMDPRKKRYNSHVNPSPKRMQRIYIQCKYSFSETLWSWSQRHKSQKFQEQDFVVLFHFFVKL